MDTEMCGVCGYQKEAISGEIHFADKNYAYFLCNDCKGENK